MKFRAGHEQHSVTIERIANNMVRILSSQHGGSKGIYCGENANDDLVVRILGAYGAINRRKFPDPAERETLLRAGFDQMKAREDVHYQREKGRVLIEIRSPRPSMTELLPEQMCALYVPGHQVDRPAYDDLCDFETRHHRILQGAL